MFLDTVNTPTIPKKLRRLSAQDPGESRRRWHLVTEALKKRDMEAASDAKHMVGNLIFLTNQRIFRHWNRKCYYSQPLAWMYSFLHHNIVSFLPFTDRGAATSWYQRETETGYRVEAEGGHWCILYMCPYYLYLLPPLQLFHAEGQAWMYNNPLSKRLKELNTWDLTKIIMYG